MTYLARVAEFYRATLGADTGYTGVLSSNPVHEDYQTSYPRMEPYGLGDLARAIPRGWQLPRPATTTEGRNVELFRALCKLALRCSDDGLLTWARSLNRAFAVSLADGEGTWHLALCVPLPGALARPRASARLALETGRTGPQGRRGVRCGASGWLAHRTATVGRPWHQPGLVVPAVPGGESGRRKPGGERVDTKPIQIDPLRGGLSVLLILRG